MSERTLQDRAAGIQRQIKALGRIPEEWDASDLELFWHLEAEIEEVRARAVKAIRATGTTDAQIARALGVTRQAVSKRWPGDGRYVGAAGRYRTGVNVSYVK